jgi:anthranilate synthase/aminodeoxychorismate synthase-like glutamine amidotransferase
MSLLIIDNYDSFTFNLYQMLQAQTEHEVVVKRNDQIRLDEIENMQPAGIVLSPGPGHPSNAGDFGVCAEIVTHAQQLNVPVLGVCLGHQGIAHYLGGKVERAPHIVHGKTSSITITAASPIFRGLPQQFTAMRYHSLVVDEKTLPERLQVTARDTGTSLVMAVQHKDIPLFGVQFHPESIGTPEGATILRNFVELC